MALLPGDRRAASLQPLHQTREIRCWVQSHQDVHVGTDHAQFENVSPFLPAYATEEPAQEPGQAGIDYWSAVASGPNDVAIDSVDHT